jgi:cell wall-associated NlpC family hydrolase
VLGLQDAHASPGANTGAILNARPARRIVAAIVALSLTFAALTPLAAAARPSPRAVALPVTAPDAGDELRLLHEIRADRAARQPAEAAALPAVAIVELPVARHTSHGRRAAPKRLVAPVSVAPASGSVAVVLAFLERQLGKPYRYGAVGPGAFDCSGLLVAAWAQVGVHLPHKAAAIGGLGRRVGRGELQPGDVVIMSGGGHAGVYVGSGLIVHAPHSGDHVRVAPIWAYSWAVRLT